MPTNLTPEARKKWNEASLARRPHEKLQKLQEFLSLIPKHKGTSRLCAQVKRQIATLRREIEESRKRKVGRGGSRFFIEKEGAAQLVILGPTKVGRSSLLASTTNAKVEVSDYPYTTQEPVPGMLQHEDLQFQLVEAPALVKGAADGEARGLQTLGLARNADGLILVVDLSQNPREQLSLVLGELQKARILTQKPQARVEIERKHVGVGLRIVLFGRLIDCSMQDVEAVLKGYRIRDAMVKIHGKATLDDVEDAIFESTIYRPALVVANKTDRAEATKNLNELIAFTGNKYTVLAVSCKNPFGLEKLGAELFRALDIMRIYTKEPAKKEPSPKPFILTKGSTAADLARLIHTDFYRSFSYARVWGKRLRFSPQKVGASFVLEDKDIVELHAK
ncbi:MAG: TGS domain-containing protein [Candidatus Bathyarchaeota archaeon]|nr:TGS domain-containing protein [Candidatus Bathyarchaeota archaeon]